MRKIVEQGVVTLDGVTSTPQNWVVPNWDDEYQAVSRDVLFAADALLYGRQSYEAHAEVWPAMEEGYGDYAVRMNSIPKYVASRTLRETKWNATLIA